jgi:hypothetical protein
MGCRGWRWGWLVRLDDMAGSVDRCMIAAFWAGLESPRVMSELA